MADLDQGLLADLLARAKVEIEEFGRLRRSLGTAPAVLAVSALTLALIWWKWEELGKRPGVANLFARIRRRRILPSKQDSLTIAIAHLEGDQNREHEILLRDRLDNDFEGAETKPVDRTVTLVEDGTSGREEIEKATEQARLLLRQSRADVILWGRVVRRGNKSAIRLYWTTAHQLADAKRTESYSVDTLALPPLFWDDLKQVLGMLAQSRLALIREKFTGHYVADRLLPLIEQVRQLLQARQGTWTAETETDVRFALANALQDYGSQGGSNDALSESIAAYNQVLAIWTRERAPLDWAMTQNNLGNTLVTLGQRENDTARLLEAVDAYRAALKEWTRERMPLEWAATQNNLGNVLTTLGQRENDTARLLEAVDACRAALKEWTRERGPLQWAMTQNNLGNALWALGEHERGTARLKEAVVAYRAALKEWTRAREPLQWATTQNNLGAALMTLGQRENDTAPLLEAVDACRAALKERTRARAPLDWATTQYNLGSVLTTLGQRENSAARLLKAVDAYNAALKEWTRERMPLQWAMTQNNLGNALMAVSQRENDTAHLIEAVDAYRAALKEERRPLALAGTLNNLAIAQSLINERREPLHKS